MNLHIFNVVWSHPVAKEVLAAMHQQDSDEAYDTEFALKRLALSFEYARGEIVPEDWKIFEDFAQLVSETIEMS